MLWRIYPKFKYFYRDYKNKEFNLLDVGCGNNSARQTKKFFKECNYYGIDKDTHNNTDETLSLMEKFYELDLSCNKLEDIPDNFFNVIIVNHVIEHLSNGVNVISDLTTKLQTDGVIYIEFPSVKSLKFPSMKGTLNFCDDPTHVKLYDVKEICNILLEHNYKIIKAGNRRDPVRILLSPLILISLVLRKRPITSILWDLMGFADFVYAKKM